MPNLIAALRASTHHKKTTCFELHLRMYVHPLQSIAIHCNYNDYYNNYNPGYNDYNVQNGQYDNWFHQSQAQPMQTQDQSTIPDQHGEMIDTSSSQAPIPIPVHETAFALPKVMHFSLVK